ncbi:MAG: serine dehydratase, partial [Firmicutes bacterium]|nr:serine dehydratase [Bacillota bacterium]
MRSIKSIYKIGNGPSSSHTVGPYHAAQVMKERYAGADRFEVTLFGSLAFTGEGHGTGKAIQSALPEAEILYDRTTPESSLPHPNTMLFKAYKGGNLIGENRIFSIGGGSIRIENETSDEDSDIYPEKNFTEVMNTCKTQDISLLQYIYNHEGYELKVYLKKVWDAMKDSIQRGLEAEGTLPGGLGVARKAKTLYNRRCYNEGSDVTM